jgi:hypothetical protein
VKAELGLGLPARATSTYSARAAAMVTTPAMEDTGRSTRECPIIQIESARKRSGVTG